LPKSAGVPGSIMLPKSASRRFISRVAQCRVDLTVELFNDFDPPSRSRGWVSLRFQCFVRCEMPWSSVG
jgi:hypothetical protein